MIQTIGVSKKFEDVQAVNSLSLEIRQEVFGLVGTNGAGKSTLLRMLCGILKQDEGTIAVDGQPVFEEEATKRELFYISDDSYFFPTALRWIWSVITGSFTGNLIPAGIINCLASSA